MSDRDDRDAFERAVAENRYDESVRRVFADWLEERGFDDEARFQHLWTVEWQQSVDWMEQSAKRLGMSYEGLLAAGRKWLGAKSAPEGRYWRGYTTQSGGMDWQDWLEGREEEYWRHYEIVTRTTVADEDKQNFFSCSC